MSVFGGRMREYRFLSIDRFDKDNLLSWMFFLSHCHEDHMTGLDNKRFVSHLAANNLRLYVHEVTYLLLMHDAKYRHLEPYIEPLERDLPYMLSVPKAATANGNGKEGDTITVTLLGAGHCPGSVMFLFEGSEGTVLYTGDIRLNLNDLLTMEHLKTGEQVKQIKSIYFDSTFCTYDTTTIVDRKESLRAMLELIRSHLSENKTNQVLLYCVSKYGHEFLMCELSKALDMKIHVTGSKRALYEKIPGIRPYVTDDGLSTRVHACAFYDVEDDWQKLGGRGPKPPALTGKQSLYSIPCCQHCRAWDNNVMIIKPSMLWFQQSRSIRDVVHYDEKGSVYRVQYSCHSSLTEIRDLLSYLRPTNALPNVVPFRSKDYTPVHAAIKDLIPAVALLSPKKFNSSLELSSTLRLSGENSERRPNGAGVEPSTSEFVPNFEGRKRYIASVLAANKKLKHDDKRKKKQRPPPDSWDACLLLSDDSDNDSDSGSSDGPENESSDSCSLDSSSGSSQSSDSSVGIVEEPKVISASGVRKQPITSAPTVAELPAAIVARIETEEQPAEVKELANASRIETESRPPSSDSVQRLSSCSERSDLQPTNDQGLDSDVDLFDLPVCKDDDDDDAIIVDDYAGLKIDRPEIVDEKPAAPSMLCKSDDDDAAKIVDDYAGIKVDRPEIIDEKPETPSMLCKSDSVELIGCFSKGDIAPVITLSSPEDEEEEASSGGGRDDKTHSGKAAWATVAKDEGITIVSTTQRSSEKKSNEDKKRSPWSSRGRNFSPDRKGTEPGKSSDQPSTPAKPDVKSKPRSSVRKEKETPSKLGSTSTGKTTRPRKKYPSPTKGHSVQRVLDEDDEDWALLMGSSNDAASVSPTKTTTAKSSESRTRGRVWTGLF